MSIEAEEYLSIHDAAAWLGVSRRHIWQLVKRGDLPAFENPVDRRSKLIPVQALRALRQPHKVDMPYPKSAGNYRGPVTVHSDEIGEYLDAHWATE